MKEATFFSSHAPLSNLLFYWPHNLHCCCFGVKRFLFVSLFSQPLLGLVTRDEPPHIFRAWQNMFLYFGIMSHW